MSAPLSDINDAALGYWKDKSDSSIVSMRSGLLSIGILSGVRKPFRRIKMKDGRDMSVWEVANEWVRVIRFRHSSAITFPIFGNLHSVQLLRAIIYREQLICTLTYM